MKLYLKIICLLTAFAAVLTLVSCTNDYASESTADTDAVTEDKSYPAPDYTSHADVMSIDGKNVTYEEYRYYFLNIKEKYDRSDSTFWNSNIYDKEIRKEAEKYLVRQYAIETLAEQYEVSLSDEDLKTLDATIETNKSDFKTIDEYNEYLDSASVKPMYSTSTSSFSAPSFSICANVSAAAVRRASSRSVPTMILDG